MCPSLLEPRTGDHPEAYAANIYNNRPPHQQQHYDPPSSSTYNPGWRNQAPFQNNNVGQNRSSYVQAATKPSFATFFLSVLQAPDWTPPFDLECDIGVYALGTVLARHIWHQGHFGHYKWKMCAKVKIVAAIVHWMLAEKVPYRVITMYS
ncbi:hypothetical protein Lal_00015278 [Lupinus albus]|nr:hypothetical protein Lal_00015278 [Lupinus albus]